ncbi:hypothetical protein B0A51_18683, partial [Rachicladosporium sp. CCFEE 5018]
MAHVDAYFQAAKTEEGLDAVILDILHQALASPPAKGIVTCGARAVLEILSLGPQDGYGSIDALRYCLWLTIIDVAAHIPYTKPSLHPRPKG